MHQIKIRPKASKTYTPLWVSKIYECLTMKDAIQTGTVRMRNKL